MLVNLIIFASLALLFVVFLLFIFDFTTRVAVHAPMRAKFTTKTKQTSFFDG